MTGTERRQLRTYTVAARLHLGSRNAPDAGLRAGDAAIREHVAMALEGQDVPVEVLPGKKLEDVAGHGQGNHSPGCRLAQGALAGDRPVQGLHVRQRGGPRGGLRDPVPQHRGQGGTRRDEGEADVT